MVKRTIALTLFLILISHTTLGKEIIEHTIWGKINWSYFVAEANGVSDKNLFLFSEKNSLKPSIRIARIRAFKKLYNLVLNLPLQENKPFKFFISKDKEEELIQRIYKNAYVLGWMNVSNEKIELNVKVDLIKPILDFIYPFLKKEYTEQPYVFIIDGRDYDIKPSIICKIFNEQNKNIYSFYPKYVLSMEEALLYAGPRKISFLKIKEIKDQRCSFTVYSDIKKLTDVILVIKDENNN